MSTTATRETARKSHIGEVTSKMGDKSIKVTYFYQTPHPQYGKEVKRKTVLHAHDEANTAKVGDKVEVTETRPLSKLKRWRVIRIVEVAKIAGQASV